MSPTPLNFAPCQDHQNNSTNQTRGLTTSMQSPLDSDPPPDVSKTRWAPPAPSPQQPQPSTSTSTSTSTSPSPSPSTSTSPSPSPSTSPSPSPSSYQSGAPISSLGTHTSFSSTTPREARSTPRAGGGALSTGTEATLGYRYDYEAPAAYALGPFGAVALLVLEVENDWVRYHAWQSVLLTGVVVSLHLVWAVLGLYLLARIQLLVECAVFILLTWQTYRDADLLDRYELPWIGRIANQWVEAE